jgi:hypothetical protein
LSWEIFIFAVSFLWSYDFGGYRRGLHAPDPPPRVSAATALFHTLNVLDVFKSALNAASGNVSALVSQYVPVDSANTAYDHPESVERESSDHTGYKSQQSV